jgi:hypothetical protein
MPRRVISMKKLFRWPTVGRIAVCVLVMAMVGACAADENEQVSGPQDLPELTKETTRLDLDGDGAEDFLFRYRPMATTPQEPSSDRAIQLEVRGIEGNEVQFALPCGACPLPEDTMIDDALKWTTYGATLASLSWTDANGWDEQWSGPWTIAAGGFLGLRISIDGAIHYGWAHVRVSSATGELTVLDSAYQPEPGVGIPSGRKP